MAGAAGPRAELHFRHPMHGLPAHRFPAMLAVAVLAGFPRQGGVDPACPGRGGGRWAAGAGRMTGRARAAGGVHGAVPLHGVAGKAVGRAMAGEASGPRVQGGVGREKRFQVEGGYRPSSGQERARGGHQEIEPPAAGFPTACHPVPKG